MLDVSCKWPERSWPNASVYLVPWYICIILPNFPCYNCLLFILHKQWSRHGRNFIPMLQMKKLSINYDITAAHLPYSDFTSVTCTHVHVSVQFYAILLHMWICGTAHTVKQSRYWTILTQESLVQSFYHHSYLPPYPQRPLIYSLFL